MKSPINIRIETLSAVNIGEMISWKYNGVHVYSDDEPYKKVFIKKANGKQPFH